MALLEGGPGERALMEVKEQETEAREETEKGGEESLRSTEERREETEGEGKESLTDPPPHPFSRGPQVPPKCHLAALFPGGLPTQGPAFHTPSAARGLGSSFCFVFLPGRKWLQMLWVGPSLAGTTVPRFLMIPGDRSGTSNQPQRGAEPCLRMPHAPANLSL